jgi:ABC-2 type transport system permease protein
MSRPAPGLAAAVAQASMELRLTARRGENILVMLVIPAVVLVFFSSTEVIAVAGGRSVDVLLPGTLALAIIAASLVNLSIATAYERQYGVLKRLGGSPLTRGGLVAAKIGVVLLVEAVVIGMLLAIASLALGWTPQRPPSVPALAAAWLAGTLAFGGLGLLLAGALRAEATLAFANGLFVAALLLGGILLPVDRLPALLGDIARILPAAALTDAFGVALGGSGDLARSLALLLAWGTGAILLTVRTFRWE